MERRADQSIETLRGLAVVLMVAGHVIGQTENRGLEVAHGSLLQFFYYSFQYLRMPLFTFIAGFIYAGRPVLPGATRDFLRHKIARLLIPFATVSTLQFLVQLAIPAAHAKVSLSQWPGIFIWPHDQFWFLPAMFGIFAVVALLDSTGLLNSKRRWLMAFGLAVLLRIGVHLTTNIFGLWGTVALLPPFLFGYAVRRYSSMLTNVIAVRIAAFGFILAYAVQQYVYFGEIELTYAQAQILSMSVGETGLILLFALRRPIPALAGLGKYCYTIFLLHIFGTAGVRIICGLAGVQSLGAVFALSLTGGLLFPILVHRAFAENRLVHYFFLGNARPPVELALARRRAPVFNRELEPALGNG